MYTYLSMQVDDVCHNLAISLHSYSQALPIIAGECLHNYSQPISLPAVGANTEVCRYHSLAFYVCRYHFLALYVCRYHSLALYVCRYHSLVL